MTNIQKQTTCYVLKLSEGPCKSQFALTHKYASTHKLHKHLLATTSIATNESHQKPRKLFTDCGTEESVGEVQLIVGVTGLGGDA